MHFVYLIYNTSTKESYIGETNDLNRRINEHQQGSNISTKYKCSDWKCVYAEIYKSKKDALIRERKLKAHGSGLVELKKRIIYSLETMNNRTGEGKR